MKKVNRGATVRILGKDYQVACTEDERENLLLAAEYLERKLEEIRQGGKVIGTEKSAVMVALNISYELTQLRSDLDRLEANKVRLGKLHDKVQGIVDQYRQLNL